MKPAHLPVLWKQAPVKPFKYNPKAEEQEKPAFVKIKAKFLPNKDAFGFDSLLEAPTTDRDPQVFEGVQERYRTSPFKVLILLPYFGLKF